MKSPGTKIESDTLSGKTSSKDELVDRAIESLMKINQQFLEEQEKQSLA